MSHEILLRKQLYDETINIYGTYNDPLFKNNEIELLITTNNTSEYLNLKELDSIGFLIASSIIIKSNL